MEKLAAYPLTPIAMDRGAFLNAAAGDQRQTVPGALPLSRLPRLVHAGRSGAPQNASRLGDPSVQEALPGPTADPGDLVVRALAILAEEAEAWQARRGAAPRSIR